MENVNRQLWNRDFALVVIGQIISLFGNSILRFSLSLYILKVTGSAAVFGSINGASLIPMVLLTPFGGMIADRLNRRDVMVVLDFLTALLVFVFAVTIADSRAVVMIAVTMVLLSVIQSFYTPSVQSSVPFLQQQKNLVRANAVVNQVSMLANLIGPVLGGFLFAFVSIRSIIIVAGAAFFISAVLELYIRIPHEKQAKKDGLWLTVKADFSESLQFMTKNKPDMFKVAMSITALNLFAAGLVSVGVPFLITTVLGLGEELYGVALGLMAGAGIFGALLTGILSGKLRLSKMHLFYIALTLCVTPIGLSFLLNLPPMVIYVITVAGVMLGQMCASILAIFLMSTVQKMTPNSLLGKIMAFINTLTMCAMPLGSFIYGILFDKFSDAIYIVVFFAAAALFVIGLAARGVFRRLD